jgi:hypothetical protein
VVPPIKKAANVNDDVTLGDWNSVINMLPSTAQLLLCLT